MGRIKNLNRVQVAPGHGLATLGRVTAKNSFLSLNSLAGTQLAAEESKLLKKELGAAVHIFSFLWKV